MLDVKSPTSHVTCPLCDVTPPCLHDTGPVSERRLRWLRFLAGRRDFGLGLMTAGMVGIFTAIGLILATDGQALPVALMTIGVSVWVLNIGSVWLGGRLPGKAGTVITMSLRAAATALIVLALCLPFKPPAASHAHRSCWTTVHHHETAPPCQR